VRSLLFSLIRRKLPRFILQQLRKTKQKSDSTKRKGWFRFRRRSANTLEQGKHDIKAPTLSARCTYLSSERDTLDGLNIHFAGIDEYHAHPTDGVANVLRSGMQARRNPLHLTITTAGF
jgi:phage terminase large subunit-like protein